MTEKEKAKAYDEAIDRAKKIYGNGIIERIFPELKEGDDERIKKNCIYFLELQKQHHAATFETEECIAWLEKQGKQLADKNKPRFEVGDWVVFITSESVYQVEKKENYEYTLRNILGGSMCLPFSNEELIREWTIQDAKDGDVLVNGSNIFIFYFINNRRLMGYCHVNMNDGNFYNDIGRIECFCTIDAPVTPATKKQRNALMKSMNDVGYEWNAETKTLEKFVESRFDPKTLEPFDRVLVKVDSYWRIELFSSMYEYMGDIYYACSRGSYKECIPYNDDTKHLIGTNDEALEYYRYWED